MGQKNRTLIVILIAVVIVVAVFSSFGLYLIPGRIPTVELPLSGETASPGASEDPIFPNNDQYRAVEVTPDTVQSVIATLARADSYARELTIRDYWSGTEEPGITSIYVWVDGGFTRVQTLLPSGRYQNTLLTGDTRYLWYDLSQRWLSFPADETTPDWVQRFPSYEDVLALDPGDIASAGYTVYESWSCIYVEVAENDLGYLQRYWVDISSGLLVGAETESDGQVVYQMSSASLQSPCPTAASFQLPDGTVLHQVS